MKTCIKIIGDYPGTLSEHFQEKIGKELREKLAFHGFSDMMVLFEQHPSLEDRVFELNSRVGNLEAALLGDERDYTVRLERIEEALRRNGLVEVKV